MSCSVARRSETRSWCGEKLSYGSVSQSGSRRTRSSGANQGISSARRCASTAWAQTTATIGALRRCCRIGGDRERVGGTGQAVDGMTQTRFDQGKLANGKAAWLSGIGSRGA
jgi:hypothetical protein